MQPYNENLRLLGKKSQRGVALLMVLIVITILIVVIIDISYSTRIDSEIAINQQNELKAFYLARSGYEFSKIILRLDSIMQGKMGDLTSKLGSIADKTLVEGQTVDNIVQNTHIWDLIPGVTAYPPMIASILGGSGADKTEVKPDEKAEEAKKSEKPKRSEQENLETEEYYESEIRSESCRINLNAFANEKSQDIKNSGMVRWMLNMFNLEEFADLFKDRPENKETIVYAIKDWIDPDNLSSNMMKGGDENTPYMNSKYRYKAKNAKFDSLEEVMLVDGMTGEIYNRIFSKYFTVFGDEKFNLHCDLDQFAPVFKATLSPFVTMNKADFIKQLKQKDFKNSKEYQNVVKEITGVTSEMAVEKDVMKYLGAQDTKYRVISTGTAQDSIKTLLAIVNKPKGPTQPFDLLYWRVN